VRAWRANHDLGGEGRPSRAKAVSPEALAVFVDISVRARPCRWGMNAFFPAGMSGDCRHVCDGLPRLRFATDFPPSVVLRHSSDTATSGSHESPGLRITKGGSALNACLYFWIRLSSPPTRSAGDVVLLALRGVGRRTAGERTGTGIRELVDEGEQLAKVLVQFGDDLLLALVHASCSVTRLDLTPLRSSGVNRSTAFRHEHHDDAEEHKHGYDARHTPDLLLLFHGRHLRLVLRAQARRG